MNRTITGRRLAIACTLASASLLPACSQPKSDAPHDPVAALSNPRLNSTNKVDEIVAAGEDARAGKSDPKAFRESMKKILWRRSEFANVRLAALKELAADEEHTPDTITMLALLMPTENDWGVLDAICALAAERQWTDLTPGLVRSWSRPVEQPEDANRPERAALIALHPGEPVEAIVFQVFATPTTGAFAERTRTDAWALLCRLDKDGARTKSLLSQEPPADIANDPLTSDLFAGARDLSSIPRTGPQLEWLRDMRQPEHSAFWRESVEAIASLTPEQREGFELRHVVAVRWAAANAPDLFALSKSQLADRVKSQLSGVRPHRRNADSADMLLVPKENFATAEPDLVWGDDLLILIALQSLRDPDVIAALFTQADADLKDHTTEYGGILDTASASAAPSPPSGAASPRFVAIPYPPRPAQRVADNRFVASSDLLKAGATALFHYHFHCQNYSNADYAGPGPGDIEYAQNFGRSCIVFTFLNKDSLNADYYQPSGARLDLGEIRRPAAPEKK